MTDAWKQTRELTQRNAGGIFKRLQNDGEAFICAVRGAPFGRETHWLNASEEYAVCVGKGCEHCTRGLKKSARVKINVYILAENAMKIFECSGKTFEDICNARESFDFGKWAVEIKRHGAAKLTKTKYTVFPKREMTADERARADSAPFMTFVEHADDAAEEEDEGTATPPAPPPPRDPNAKIAPSVYAEFRERLRRLPKETAYYPILSVFGCERLDEVLAVDEHRARTLIERAERGEKIGLPAPASELDEFA